MFEMNNLKLSIKKNIKKSFFKKNEVNKKGVSIIIVTYKRNDSLFPVLKSLIKQKTNFPAEIILINNWNEQKIKIPAFFKFFYKVYSKISRIKVYNLKYNFGCGIRYHFAAHAKYDTIFMLDDDIELISKDYLQRMFDKLNTLSNKCILSSWGQRFKAPKMNYYQTEAFGFIKDDKDINGKEIDLIGPGICMYRKEILSPELVNIPERYKDVDNVWFSVMCTQLKNVRKIYFSAHQQLKIHAASETMAGNEYIANMKNIAVEELTKENYCPVYLKEQS